MQLPVQQSSFGSKAPAAFHAQPAANRRGRVARLVPQAAAVVDKPSTSQSHSNGNGNGSSAYGGGAYADGNTTNGASHADGPVILNGQILHNITKQKLELVSNVSDSGVLANSILPILKDTQTIWQPADFLPDPSQESFIEEVTELRKRTADLPDDYFVVLIGDLITEEALPTYMAMLNTLDGVRDETGAAPTPWARWTRQWTSEENRHGDLMNKYCYLSGKVNMRAVEVTIQNLITSGMDPKTENDPYLGFIYTSFQERATKISHGNTAAHAAKYGDKTLGKIMAAIAGDEARHEKAYIKIVDEFFKLDPSGALISFADMMKKQIVMPAHLMNDGVHTTDNGRNLFKDFSSVAQTTKTYTGQDYMNIMQFLMKHWDIAGRTGLSVEAQQAQEDVCKLQARFQKLTERQSKTMKSKKTIPTKFSWVFDRPIDVLAI